MIEEQGRVIDVHDGYVWVETQRRSSCDKCSANTGCGTSVLSKVLGQRRTRVRALDSLGTKTGDEVVIGIEDAALLRSSLAAYLVPLLGLLLGALCGGTLAARLGISDEAGSILCALAGLAAGIVWLSYYARRTSHDRRYQPVVLRRTAHIIYSNQG
jgi:sigma-E factor negative regulatory protein RseC